jgi:hypothetical protein
MHADTGGDTLAARMAAYELTLQAAPGYEPADGDGDPAGR